MFLYLLRHADASTAATNDDARRLSDKGHAQVKRAAEFCAMRNVIPELILTSPLARARETAEAFAAALDPKVKTEVADFLKSGMLPQAALDALKRYSIRNNVMLVGHEPDFSLLAAHLLGLKSHTALRIRKCSLMGMDVPLFVEGAARLEFLVPCRIM